MQTISEDQKARIAAEVAARYGVQCKPDVVQVVPRGVSGLPGYEYVERIGLRQVDGKSGRDTVKAMIGAGVREAARKRRLAVAKAKEEADAPPAVKAYKPKRKLGPRSPDDPRMVAARERLERTMGFAGKGDKTVRQIADFLGISWNAAQNYCRLRQIPYRVPEKGAVAQVRRQKKVEAAQKREALAARREKVAELFKQGWTAPRIQQEVGSTRNEVHVDLKRLGLKRADYPALITTPKKSNHPPPKRRLEEMKAIAAERRAKVVVMRAEGKTVRQIAEALGVGSSTITDDILQLGLNNSTRGHVGNPAFVRQVKAMRARKMTVREIAAVIGVNWSTVHRIMKKLEAA